MHNLCVPFTIGSTENNKEYPKFERLNLFFTLLNTFMKNVDTPTFFSLFRNALKTALYSDEMYVLRGPKGTESF